MGLADLSGDLLERFWLNSAYFAEPVKWTPAGGEAVTITADVGEETIERTERAGKRVILRRREFVFSLDAALDCGGIADAAQLLGGRFTYPASGGREYAVERVIELDPWGKVGRVEAVNVDETGEADPRAGLRGAARLPAHRF